MLIIFITLMGIGSVIGAVLMAVDAMSAPSSSASGYNHGHNRFSAANYERKAAKSGARARREGARAARRHKRRCSECSGQLQGGDNARQK